MSVALRYCPYSKLKVNFEFLQMQTQYLPYLLYNFNCPVLEEIIICASVRIIPLQPLGISFWHNNNHRGMQGSERILCSNYEYFFIGLRGHSLKLFKNKYSSNIGKFSFSNRVWNTGIN